MRYLFAIAIPAARSGWAELTEEVREHHLCPFCDLPWLCVGALAYLGKSCLFHHARSRRASFLDREPEAQCNCPHCLHSSNPRRAA